MTEPAEDVPPAVVPVFPLPETVLFPGMILPLRVFEPRYLEMIEHCRAASPWLVVTLLKPGFAGDYFAAPEFHTVATLGKILEFEPRDDGTVHIRVEGRFRVKLEEVPADTAYRSARITRMEEDSAWLDGEAGGRELSEVARMALGVNLIRKKNHPGGTIPEATRDRMALVNTLAGSVPADNTERQAFLEASDYESRLRLVRDQVEILVNTIAALVRIPRPDDPKLN
jgi:ATP-dependent Lon protease